MARVVIYPLGSEINALNRLGSIDEQTMGRDKQSELSPETDNMVGQSSQKIKLTAEQRRNLGHVYRMILGWRRDRKNKAVSQPSSESLPEEQQTQQPDSDSAEQTESES